ncbi:MAG: hypothetical protein OXI91_14130 [Chloroflexota bacterium]|nr:hypothetical protein [Chloroflexota bacterium]
MTLSRLLKSAAGTCPHCNEKAGILSREHSECRRTFDSGFQEMVNLAADAARSHTFDEKSLRLALAEVARRSYGDGATVNQALEEGWKQGLAHCMADGIMTQAEESRLREFRDRLALEDSGADRKATEELEKAAIDRITFDARLAAVAVENPEHHLAELSQSLRQSSLNQGQQTALLVRAWEAAVEGTLEDGLLTRDEENALHRYLDHFNITVTQADDNGVLTILVQAAVIRDITEGIVPQRQNINGRIPFNLMKSEQLIWVMDGVDYLEVVTRRERRGSSHGLSIRVARGVYYRPGVFRSRSVEWEETVHQDTGLLGFTTKHLYFSGPKKKFRVRYDRIVDFEPFSDGFGLMRDAQTAKPQSFRTGDGWFAFNLATNLAQM